MKRILTKCAMCAMFVALASCGAVKPKQQNLNIFNELDIEFGDAKEDVLKKIEDAGARYRINDEDYEIYGVFYPVSEFNTTFSLISFDFDDGKLRKLETGTLLDLDKAGMDEKFADIIDRFTKRGYKVEHHEDSLTAESDYWAMTIYSQRLHEGFVLLNLGVVDINNK